MPTLYRIGCLRDDVIFFIYLYQKWVYPTDMNRMNEYGTTGDMDSDVKTDDNGQIQDGAREIQDGADRPDETGEPKVKDDAEKKNDWRGKLL